MRVHFPFHWTVRTWLGRSPTVFNAVFGLVNDGSRLTRPGTELVIEGFPRSGNSFSVFAFSNSGADALHLAHHVHAPSQIILAARYRLPAVLLIREPDAAVAAGLAKVRTHRAPDLLRAYALYYRLLVPLRSHYVVAPFETVTTDVGRIVDAVNRRFSTHYVAIDADRHRQLSKAFLAQEKADAMLGGPPSEPPGAADTRYDSSLADRARAIHARFLQMAADDGTN